MHIAIFLDQHPDTLGGAQLSVVMQARYLRELGHRVTLCSPSGGDIKLSSGADNNIVEVPSHKLGFKSEYKFFIPSQRTINYVDEEFAKLTPVDVVHIQSDFWGAIIGYVYAKKHNLPTVVTFHNNVAVGAEHVLGGFVSRLFIGWISKKFIKMASYENVNEEVLRFTTDGWKYLAQLGAESDIRLAPTAHFARDLEAHGVKSPVRVCSNGLDDEIIKNIEATRNDKNNQNGHRQNERSRPLIVWTGRMSKEKRLMEFLEAVNQSKINADVAVYGSGDLQSVAQRYVSNHNLSETVKFYGKVSPDEMLKAIADADMLVQTSIGFETQGRTVLEALTFGVPVVLCDPAIAEDFDENSYWLVENNTVESLAATLKIAADSFGSEAYKTPPSSLKTAFLQSKLSADMARVYQEVL